MRLTVRVIGARNLRAMDFNGFSDPYVKLQVGKQRFKTKVVKMNLNPEWDQEFSFVAADVREVLKLDVYDEDMIGTDDFLGQVRVTLEDLLAVENFSLGTRWYQLLPKTKSDKAVDCGEICLAISLETAGATRSWSDDLATELTGTRKEYSLASSQSAGSSSAALAYEENEASKEDNVNEYFSDGTEVPEEDKCGEVRAPEDRFNGIPTEISNEAETSKTEKLDKPSLVDRVYQMFAKKNDDISSTSLRKTEASEEVQQATAVFEAPLSQNSDICSDVTFDELLGSFESRHEEVEMPVNLQGILVNQSYFTSPSDLNNLLFSPDSDFRQTLVQLQNCTDFKTEPWRIDNDGESLKRVISYTTAPSKLVKAVKATEEQSYLKANGKEYSVLLSASTPDVPCGTYFRTEVLFRIMPGPELDSEQQTSHLVISWRMNFLQSTMMKSLIENGARQGLEQNYSQFSDLLSEKIKPIDVDDAGSDKEQVLASLQGGQESDWKIAFLYFCNFGVLSSLFVALYIGVHVSLVNSGAVQGLEFPGLDLPDSLSEIVMGGLLFLQVQHIFKKIICFFQAREQKVGDHGVKAQGDGWLLTVALIEGTKLAPVDATGFSDPYVVFTCNGKTKTSSIKFQTLEPQWNDIFEFDAMDDPPSVMNVHVYDFDGPFDEVTSLGHAEINFVKSNLSELADVWIPLEGNLAKSRQSKLHLRIFLNNSKGTGMVTEYLSKMEKEVGKKMTLRSPRTNTAFQELFSLPAEEFLISSFTCYLKRKLPTQGHLFLSPRIIGFYSSMFGRKTKFFFLWEDIEDIQAIPPSLSTWSPSLSITLHRGRGMDAKHGAKSVESGKLKFSLQSFASFSVANRTIMALWKARSLSSESKVQIAEEQSQNNTLQSEDSGIFVGVDDSKSLQMSEVFSSTISANMNSLLEVFEGGSLEMKVMEKVGCLKYSATQWESDKPDEYQRQIHYKFSRKLSPVGGEVTGTQLKSPMPNKKGWIIEEVMELQGVLLGDFFTLHIKYQFEDLAPKQKVCSVQVYLGIEWSKTTRHQKRIEKNVLSSSSARLKEMFSLASKQLSSTR
ncbi:C2 and GRAM domain-containing protein At1g03370-like [Hordeum vulgare subsp. vulgare]|uniref:Predicted protein n=1 Tax=Hordeum vulgare subsp. vulgare TaxID=112509 RepID=F2E3M0_HORVV|nr:C2 and GRAM domain-containing protein At1g03370-like [Hordeum vulgare subsp. vulgare]BAK01942.1 predicted protein [Hordeum vulgare subsp. vulgare]